VNADGARILDPFLGAKPDPGTLTNGWSGVNTVAVRFPAAVLVGEAVLRQERRAVLGS
jgi:hypothetical protein